MKRKEYKCYLQTVVCSLMKVLWKTCSLMKYLRADWQRKAIRKQVTGEIISYEQLDILPFASGTLMAKLIGGHNFDIHSLMETTLSFFAGYDTRVLPQLEVLGGCQWSNCYNRAPLQHKHILEVELFMLAVYTEEFISNHTAPILYLRST